MAEYLKFGANHTSWYRWPPVSDIQGQGPAQPPGPYLQLCRPLPPHSPWGRGGARRWPLVARKALWRRGDQPHPRKQGLATLLLRGRALSPHLNAGHHFS